MLFPGQYNYNASFERVCISNWLKKKYPRQIKEHYDFDAHGGFLNPAAWRCDMVWAAYNGLPLALAQVGAVLKLEQQKMSEGRTLIRYFCTPTIDEDGNCHFHSPSDAPEKWKVFKAYNKRDVEVEMAIQEKLRKYPLPDFVWDEYRGGMMFIRLPSGRSLAYAIPRICENQFGGEGISYYGITAQKKFERIESYGPKLVENITQAISRDILAHAMKTLRKERIVGHVHDEIILEAEKDASVQDICEQMGRTPAWISGLVLRADGYECEYYRKD